MESSGPTESTLNFLASRSTLTPINHQQFIRPNYLNRQNSQPQQHQTSSSANSAITTVLSSTPMQRSLTHNPAMASFSNSSSSIAAATSDPSSVSISVSSSSPTSLPAPSPSSSLSNSSYSSVHNTFTEHEINAVSVMGDHDNPGNFNSNDRPTESHDLPTSATRDNRAVHWESQTQSNRGHTGTEADDRIHFRLLNNIYFSTSTRQSHLGDDQELDSAVLPSSNESSHDMNRQNSLMTEGDRAMIGDGMGYENNGSRISMFADQVEEFASIMISSQSNHQESNEDYDDEDEDDGDDDDIDQAIDNRHRGAEEMSMDLEPSSPFPFSLGQSQHAQLSPRSAAALTSMFSDGRTSWPQPIFNSSISSDLIALSEGRTGREHDNNPYFRRPAPLSSRRESGNTQMFDTNSHNNQITRDMGSADAHRSGSILTQYGIVRHDYSSQLSLRESGIVNHGGCGVSAPATSNEAQGDVWPLKFEMYYADGGEFNASHSVENVLKNDSSVYCSRRPTNINICLRLVEADQTFVLTQFRAKAPTTGFTAPCKEGLIFVSHEPISLEKTAIFDNMTREHYEEYIQSLNQGPAFGQMLRSLGASADALVPAAFFQMEGSDETCTVDLTPNRSGRYVLIKLLRSRCTNSLQRPENIDLQYLGLIGFTGARSFASGGLL
ncbi:hypothetical protein BGX27_007319 [Mortierella sp. AM989]|nr:hypothetical protein BGX27_007319 [Mortierella sp. AM989]